MSHTETHERSLLGFWIYLMTDLLSFGVLFATYAVLSPNTAGGPNAKELFSLPFVLIETLILLTSSFTVGLAMLAVFKQAKQQALIWFGVTFLLGLTFLGMELYEFNNLIAEGASWERSAFLSSFFTLVGTHGLHISVGLLWMAVSMVMIWKRGLTPFINSKLTRLALFWHFLDIVWIFIFTIVYLLSYV
ncbi:MAG: cytochrome o ubiquinol oxidase subunit III [Candidatus Doudnabacteria bacterium RIFCSPLOWO2_02_FULL_42_9]|uniref:Cytochrome bo(3) ubiquinol oxidase subunit 3 n=1 Tax=Candidatus Doudnabacteria bacterium RIFCSPHIGHO2_01_FULL_41_86 TaxID=1817821 RepID=A0A1F5N8C3_9BACT|nr:MAG: cytochrome o ubiquinol oxidase subunit III [Candidatus Doudnabacteria bacterium RIFCSPHIGHO2_01_FULL_41_86]OGE75295.1 MAG: cytochrome o ubiquinol oxidase subunit III [Candidatus Doudnabacteria bacterium RIFCSPHIGHO2_01_43_10]OGE85821.1 MAG: cytochrome o ubiquinol oxidase subunit III [Candidatus Doudnabacteria bacterium RIFCSPHIGHO2_12_FULL_42_22]OGE87315.1 MAG: cytochrome o ubiquinol oxidase subunit III [Candidatus Doudnabacteria bacterium RIFCSPHIGHO2_02_FULL_42_25]OGE92153.1 MAG: cyto